MPKSWPMTQKIRHKLLTAGFTDDQHELLSVVFDMIDHLENRIQDKHERLKRVEDRKRCTHA